MGMDAVVFRSCKSMELEFGAKFYPEKGTGQPLPRNGKLNFALEELTAADERIGSIGTLTFLTQLCTAHLGASSVLVSQFLANRTGSGGHLAKELHQQLESEIECLKRENVPDLANLLDSLERLLAASRNEGNPISYI